MNTANPLIPGAHAARSGTPSLRGLVIAAPQPSDGLALSLAHAAKYLAKSPVLGAYE
jgi:hypothetical protein